VTGAAESLTALVSGRATRNTTTPKRPLGFWGGSSLAKGRLRPNTAQLRGKLSRCVGVCPYFFFKNRLHPLRLLRNPFFAPAFSSFFYLCFLFAVISPCVW